MIIFKRLIFSILILFALNCFSEVQMKDENGKYRHHDPEVRAEFLAIAEALRTSQMYPKAEKLLKTLTRKWSKAGYDESLNNSCMHLFYTLLRSNRLEYYQKIMEFCPAGNVRKQFLKLAGRSSFEGKLQLYSYVIPIWQNPMQKEDLSLACQRFSEVVTLNGHLEGHEEIFKYCNPMDVRKGQLNLAAEYMKKRYLGREESEKAQNFYHQYLDEWELPEAKEDVFEVCVNLTALYLDARKSKKIEALVKCDSKAIRKGYLMRANYYETWNKTTKAIRAYSELIDRW